VNRIKALLSYSYCLTEARAASVIHHRRACWHESRQSLVLEEAIAGTVRHTEMGSKTAPA